MLKCVQRSALDKREERLLEGADIWVKTHRMKKNVQDRTNECTNPAARVCEK